MDLSFTLKPRGGKPDWVASLADIKAAAEQHRAIGVGGNAGDILRGQDLESDLVRALVHAIAPVPGGLIETVPLGGSFNPHVARQLLVGKRG